MEMIQFTAIFKLCLSLMLFLLTLASAEIDWLANPTNMLILTCGNVTLSGVEGNLKVVLNSLVENVNKTGFYTSSHGQKGDTVYGLAQCRGDLNASTCRACVSNAIESVTSEAECGNSSSRSINLSGCFLKYGTQNFYTSYDADQRVTFCNKNIINGTLGNAGNLDWNTSNLLTRLVENTVSSNVSYRTLTDYGTYSLAQCWRDVSEKNCSLCLNTLFNYLGNCQSQTVQRGGLSESCMILVSTYEKFYGDRIPLLEPKVASAPSIQPSTAPSIQPFKGAGKNRPYLSLMLKLSVAGIVIVVVVLLTGLVIIWKGKHKKQLVPGSNKPASEHSTAITKSKLNYKFQTLQIATKKFNPTNKIGQGGFGAVYKGVLPNGREIAVKRLFANREQSVKEFCNEVNLISRVQHKNLLNLFGFSVDGPDKFLVYEYLPNKSLDHFLYNENMGKLLDWQRRFDIILGVAGGLAYLHQESDICIIHRDIKASNILLDQHFKPKVADFGLVRHFGEDQTHLSTTIVGTRGYMAPEYLVHGQLTEKVDVYAFGVLVLEIISGRKNIVPMHTNDMPSLLTVIWRHYLLGTISNMIDPNIEEENCEDEVLQVVQVALLCTQASARLRPSMSKVVVFLTNKEPNLPAPTQPPFIDVSDSESNTNARFTANQSQPDNNNTSGVPASEMYNPVLNFASSPAPAMSLNTISTGSFGPR